MSTPSNNLSDIICEYGRAFQQNWSDIDGREVRMDMETIAYYVNAGNTVLANEEAKELRTNLGLCPNGCGHWAFECEECGCDSEE